MRKSIIGLDLYLLYLAYDMVEFFGHQEKVPSYSEEMLEKIISEKEHYFPSATNEQIKEALENNAGYTGREIAEKTFEIIAENFETKVEKPETDISQASTEIANKCECACGSEEGCHY